MDARALLDRVADAYRNLTSLAVEQRVIVETGDEEQNNRQQYKVKAFYLAPDRYRHETCDGSGNINASNGLEFASYHARMKHFRKTPVRGPGQGVFRWESPHGLPYLFSGIGEHVAQAKWLRDEADSHVMSVEYDPSPLSHMKSRSPTEYWIDSRTLLVQSYRLEYSTRRPTHDEVFTRRQTVQAIKMVVDEPIDPKLFELELPEGAVDTSYGGAGFIGSGRGVGGGGGAQGYGSHGWSGQTFIQHSGLMLQGVPLEFERRLTISEDKQRLEIEDSVTSLGGEKTQWSQSVKLTT